MSVYFINSYDITDMELFQQYPPKVAVLLAKYGAEVLVSDTQVKAIEGQPRTMHAIIKFPSEEAALTCYNDPEYQEVRKIRLQSTTNCTMVLAKEFKK